MRCFETNDERFGAMSVIPERYRPNIDQTSRVQTDQCTAAHTYYVHVGWPASSVVPTGRHEKVKAEIGAHTAAGLLSG